MDSFSEFLKEITTKHHFLNIGIIEQINSNIYGKLINLHEHYKNTGNKYTFVAGLVRLGYELEKSIDNNSNDILSLQMNNISGLIVPIISRIKKICFELNLELVEDFKKYTLELIEEESITNPNIKKYYKFMMIHGFCRNMTYVISKELKFEDFGIIIKISNPHYKNIFTDLIQKISILTINENKDKRFDWIWKPLHNYDLEQLLNYREKNLINFTNLENSHDSFNIDNYNMNLEEFKIVQKLNNLGIENKSNYEFSIEEQSKEQIMLSNSIIIEDDSFSIPIDNI